VIAHNGPVTRNQRLWAAVLAAGDGAVCAGVTAATLEGLRGYDRAEIHLLVPADRQLGRLRGVVVHRTTALPDGQVRIQALPPRTVVARSLVDAAAWAHTDDDARAIVAAGFQQGRVTADEIGQVLTVLPRTRRRGLVRETVRYASGGAEALSEIHLAQLCRRFGLPAPDQQVQRKDRSGRQRYLDAYWHAYHLHVEVDGAWHLEVRSWWDDMRRQNDLWIRGDRVLRFPAWVLRSRPDSVAAQLRSALAAGGWRP
jgi:very-short-patch-repair endonuclease